MVDVKDDAKNMRFFATEKGESERSGGEPNGVDTNATASRVPDSDVSAQPKRRRFTPAYKTRIVEEAMARTGPGKMGALLRREGLYSSTLTLWRRQYQSGALKALKDGKRGRKRARNARDQELERLPQVYAQLLKQGQY